MGRRYANRERSPTKGRSIRLQTQVEMENVQEAVGLGEGVVQVGMGVELEHLDQYAEVGPVQTVMPSLLRGRRLGSRCRTLA